MSGKKRVFSDSSHSQSDDENSEKIVAAELSLSIAERRKKRDINDANKFDQSFLTHEDLRRPQKKKKKSKQRGWYRVEAIIGHRIPRQKNKDKIELQVKWEDYDEPTWECFQGFVRDTA